MRKVALLALLAATGTTLILGAVAFADDGDNGGSFTAHLNGYNEIVGGPGPSSTGSVSTGARGVFRAKLRKNPDRLEFELTYSGIEGGTVSQAHPHFAQRHVGGGINGFLCGGPKPPCPTPGGTVTGTWTAADVIGPADQGIQAGAFDEFVRALRAGAVYINVHSTPSYPEGEIRGQVRGGGGDDD
jgi:CHRD domain-containing protein